MAPHFLEQRVEPQALAFKPPLEAARAHPQLRRDLTDVGLAICEQLADRPAHMVRQSAGARADRHEVEQSPGVGGHDRVGPRIRR